MKVLCVCEHGNVRSVALAYLIKTIYKHEAIALGIKSSSENTREMLYEWADKIIYLDPSIVKNNEIKDKNLAKVSILDVGEDIWHEPFSQELQHKLLKNLNKLDL